MSHEKMRGHIGTGGRCPVEGHGEGCELNRELREQRLERAQEKRQWLCEARDWDTSPFGAVEAGYDKS